MSALDKLGQILKMKETQAADSSREEEQEKIMPDYLPDPYDESQRGVIRRRSVFTYNFHTKQWETAEAKLATEPIELNDVLAVFSYSGASKRKYLIWCPHHEKYETPLFPLKDNELTTAEGCHFTGHVCIVQRETADNSELHLHIPIKGYDRIAAYLLYPFDMNLPCLFSALTRSDYEVFYERLRELRQEEDAPEELMSPRGTGDGWRGIFSRTATNNFPLLCRIYGLKPSKGLRKVYTRNPAGVLVHFAMKEFGFTDVNIISDYYYRGDDIGITAKAETPGDILGNSRIYSLLGDFYKKDGKFYISKILEEKGERAAAIAMERLVRRYNPSSGDARRIIDDALKMYRSYYDELTPELRRDMIVNGPTKAVHDRLSAFITALKRKFRLFAVKPEQVALEGVSSKMIISLARNTDVLQETGSTLHNCVASYADLAAKGEVSVFTGAIEGKTVACIDVRHSKTGFSIYQALGKYNHILEPDEQMMILSWVREKNISVACTHLQQAMREEKMQKPRVPVWELVHKRNQ